MTPKILTISLLLLASCHKDDKKETTKVTQPESKPASSATPLTLPANNPVTTPEKAKVEAITISDLPKHVGKSVTLQGKISDIPWQHMMAPPAGTKHDYYFNIGESQIVLYSKEQDELKCGTTLEVTGTVLEVAGASKRGGSATLKEYHLDVASWRCLP